MTPILVTVTVSYSDDPNGEFEPFYVFDEEGNVVNPFFKFVEIKKGKILSI